jgi:hypothetical protein
MSPDLDLALQGCDKAQPNRVSGVPVDSVGKHGELIPAEPCQEITWPGDCPKALGNHLQDLIPECVAVEIIDVFEVVKVYQEERTLARRTEEKRSPSSTRSAHDGSVGPSMNLSTPAPGAHATDFS